MFDLLSAEQGTAKVKAYHPERAFYIQTSVDDQESVEAACSEALKLIPKGSLFGAVHCAATAPGRKWSNKLKDSIQVSSPLFPVIMLGD